MNGPIASVEAAPPNPPLSASRDAHRRSRRRRLLVIWAALAVPLGVLIYPRLLGNLILSAASHGNTSDVRFLLRIGAKPDAYGWYIPIDQTPLMLAASKGSLPTVQVLLDHGADVNTGVNEWSSTPLMCAVEGGHTEVARLLIARGAHLNVSDGSDDTPLTLARANRHPEIVQMLKLAGEKR